MASYQNLAEVERDIQAAKNAEDVGNTFRVIFGGGASGFTKRSAIAVDALYTALERLSSQGGAPSAIELRDLHATFRIALSTARTLRDEARAEDPAYKTLLDATEDIDKGAIKQEAESAGKSILERIKPEIDFAHQYETYRRMLERLREDDFRAAREDMAQAIREKLGSCKPPVPPVSMLCRFNEIEDIGYSECPAKYWHMLAQYKSAREECLQHPSDKWMEYKARQKEAEQFINELIDKFTAIHEDFAEALNSQSGISYEQALEWAKSNVYMDKNVEAKLRRINYPKQKLIEDVAEYFRYVGGKLGPIEFIGTRSDRAFSYSEKCQIAISKYFDKRTLFHECGHITEHVDTISLDCSERFREERAQGRPERLADLTGNDGYSSETASPDSFINPYVGKIYNYPASEVFSMAIENMSSPEKLVNFIKGDPEHFAIFLGVCSHNNPELSARLMRFSETAGERRAIQVDGEKAFQEWENAIRKAIPEFFMEALLEKEGVEGFHIKSASYSPTAKSYLVMFDPVDKGSILYITYGGTVASNVKAAYLAIMAKRKELDFGFDAPTQENLDRICDSYIMQGKVPDWFDSNDPLPKLELPPDVLAKVRKESPKAFLAAVAAACPPDLFERLHTPEGVGGFYIPEGDTPKSRSIILVHKQSGRELWCKPKAILPMAYLLIMNMRNLLPEHESILYRAEIVFSGYAHGRSVPDWFDPDTPLPELKYD